MTKEFESIFKNVKHGYKDFSLQKGDNKIMNQLLLMFYLNRKILK